MRACVKRYWRRLTAACAVGIWLAFGAGCSGSRDAKSDARFIVDIVKTLCTPEQTVDACVDLLLNLPKPASIVADAGTE